MLLVHGWDSDHIHYRVPAERIAGLGCVCLTFDLRGHGSDASEIDSVSRDDNLRDVLAAHDALARQPDVDPDAIALVGTSYGAYLAAIASELRPVQWLALRVPALYPDAHWSRPKASLDKHVISDYRSEVHPPQGNRALSACTRFRGDALIAASECDAVIPSPTIDSFVQAFTHAHSLVRRSIHGADHALSNPTHQRIYENLLVGWLSRVILGGKARTSSRCFVLSG